MFTMRCTRVLLKRLKASPSPSPPAPTTKLGDWYANLLHTRPHQLILCVSEKTLLPVVMAATGPEPVEVRLTARVGEMLRVMGLSETVVAAELADMAEAAISTTASRTVLGSMNDFAFMLDSHLRHGDTLMAAALGLSEAPCSPIDMRSPRMATIELLGRGTSR
jgi:hypothetical protein